MGTFSEYFDAAMNLAEYEEMKENDGWLGKIPGFEGLWAGGPTVEKCQDELRLALEDWVRYSLRHQIFVPTIQGIDLNKPSEAA